MAEYQYVKAAVVRRSLHAGQLPGVLLAGAWKVTQSDLGALQRKVRPQPRRRQRHAAKEYTALVFKDAATVQEGHLDLQRFMPHGTPASSRGSSG